MVDATEAREVIRAAFCNHYRTERDRSEKCIGDIIDILREGSTSDEQTNAILERIVQYYNRS